MTLGEKLLQARLEAGLSQRQLCGEEITRNMLSQIEHGTAQPSMKTLQYLAARLGKSVSYFLDESAVASPNWDLMYRARQALADGDWDKLRLLLQAYQKPDMVFDREYAYLSAKVAFTIARRAIAQRKWIYARELLLEARDYAAILPELERERLLLLGRLPGEDLSRLCSQLPSLDEELLLRARGAFQTEEYVRCIGLLDVMEVQTGSAWNLLRGHAAVKRKAWEEALPYLHRAEDGAAKEAIPLLEQCYRELGDYKQAYFYACKQK